MQLPANFTFDILKTLLVFFLKLVNYARVKPFKCVVQFRDCWHSHTHLEVYEMSRVKHKRP